MAGELQPERLHELLRYLSTGSSYEFFTLNPEGAVQQAAQELDVPLTEDERRFIATVLIETSRQLNGQVALTKERAARRIDASIRKMTQVFLLLLGLHNLMFYLGVFVLILSAFMALAGRAVPTVVLGGVGLVDLAAFLIRQPTKDVDESRGNVTQLRAAYNSYLEHLDQWQLYYDFQDDPALLDEKKEASDQIHAYTRETVALIRKYCKPGDEGPPLIEGAIRT